VSRPLSLLLIPFLVTACASRAARGPGAESTGIEPSIRAHMQFLASDALNGRGSGTRDEWVAASYVAAHFAKLGLQPVGQPTFVHEVRIERADVTDAPALRIGTREFVQLKHMLVTSFAAPRIAGALQKYTPGATVAPGSVLLLPPANPPSAAETARAAIVLSLETDAQQKRRLAASSSSAPQGPPLRLQWIVGTPRRAAIALERSAYDMVTALPDGSDVIFSANTKPVQATSTWNSVGQLPGRRRPNEYIVLSAHHDHVGNRPNAKGGEAGDTIYNGADDDASGTIAVMELASAMSHERPDRTVIFATFGSEETGGQGSTHFIDAAGVDLAKVVANLQFEMIGRPDPKVAAQTLWLTGYERSDLGEALARRGARLVADPHPEQSFFTRSDNIRFARRGVIAHTVSSYGLHTDYHEPSDEIAGIDFAHMTRAVQSLIGPIRWLANSTFIPSWNPGLRP
jgi:hypothetical protein